MSQDDTGDKKFVPHAVGSLGDLELLPKRFDAHAREMRDVLAGILSQLKVLVRIESRMDTQQDAINENDRRIYDHERRLAALEKKPRRKK